MLEHKGSIDIKTDRLLLRKFQISDAEEIFATWTSDERVAKYTSWYAHEKIEDTRAYAGYMAGIAYVLGYEYWGKGYITEAAKAVIRFLFNDVNYRKIIAGCDSENIGSSKVLEKIGMKREAVLREHIKRKDGTWGDDYTYRCKICCSYYRTDFCWG